MLNTGAPAAAQPAGALAKPGAGVGAQPLVAGAIGGWGQPPDGAQLLVAGAKLGWGQPPAVGAQPLVAAAKPGAQPAPKLHGKVGTWQFEAARGTSCQINTLHRTGQESIRILRIFSFLVSFNLTSVGLRLDNPLS